MKLLILYFISKTKLKHFLMYYFLTLPLCKLLENKIIDLKEAIDLTDDNVTILKDLRININIKSLIKYLKNHR